MYLKNVFLLWIKNNIDTTIKELAYKLKHQINNGAYIYYQYLTLFLQNLF